MSVSTLFQPNNKNDIKCKSYEANEAVIQDLYCSSFEPNIVWTGATNSYFIATQSNQIAYTTNR